MKYTYFNHEMGQRLRKSPATTIACLDFLALIFLVVVGFIARYLIAFILLIFAINLVIALIVVLSIRHKRKKAKWEKQSPWTTVP